MKSSVLNGLNGVLGRTFFKMQPLKLRRVGPYVVVSMTGRLWAGRMDIIFNRCAEDAVM